MSRVVALLFFSLSKCVSVFGCYSSYYNFVKHFKYWILVQSFLYY